MPYYLVVDPLMEPISWLCEDYTSNLATEVNIREANSFQIQEKMA